MNYPLIARLAWRYLRGKRSGNAVPILSRISMVAIAVSTAAMIVAFSVFNGIEGLVKDQYNSFYPDLRVSAARGKFFSIDSARLAAMRKAPGALHMSGTIEDNVFVLHNEQQKIITLKGITNDYFLVNALKEFVVEGDDTVRQNPNTAILGAHIIRELGADVDNVSYIQVNYPNPEVVNPSLNPLAAFTSLKLYPAGIFKIQDDFDNRYALAPLAMAQELFHARGQYSAIELKTDARLTSKTKAAIQGILGNGYKVETRYEQNKTMYSVMGAEKWVIYAITVLVLLIASFNMVGALTMLALEKQKDIAILRAMGAEAAAIRGIFLLEGILWSAVGGVAGIALGAVVCGLQQYFGLLKMGSSFVVDAYPVIMSWTDFVVALGTILVVGLLAAWYPSAKAAAVADPTLKSA